MPGCKFLHQRGSQCGDEEEPAQGSAKDQGLGFFFFFLFNKLTDKIVCFYHVQNDVLKVMALLFSF